MVESVYCAVRTDSLYKADYVSSLKGLFERSYCAAEGSVKRRSAKYMKSSGGNQPVFHCFLLKSSLSTSTRFSKGLDNGLSSFIPDLSYQNNKKDE